MIYKCNIALIPNIAVRNVRGSAVLEVPLFLLACKYQVTLHVLLLTVVLYLFIADCALVTRAQEEGGKWCYRPVATRTLLIT